MATAVTVAVTVVEEPLAATRAVAGTEAAGTEAARAAETGARAASAEAHSAEALLWPEPERLRT